MGLLAAVLGIAASSFWLAAAAAAIWLVAVAVLRTDFGVVVGIVTIPILAASVFTILKSVTFAH
jgi:tetrahydromethanopterin S-methyltransferase subunit C